MITGMKQFKIDKEQTKNCHELQATAYLNMAICWYLLKNFEKSKENAKMSLDFNKTIKGYYRLAQSYKAVQDYEMAIKNYKEAIKLDTSDPNDI
jgi:tetratricopeptide (TPR) repeat protein